MSGTSDEEREERPQEPDWSTSTLPILYPGMDYRDGKLYMTATVSKQQTIKRKGKPDQMKTVWSGLVVSTDPNETFYYNAPTLHALGYNYYENYIPNQRGWTGDWPHHWLNGTDTTTEPRDLWQRIRSIYERYIDFGSQEMHYDLCTFYVMLSYVYKVFESIPYFHFNGTAESGKSQNLRILLTLGFNASLSANLTPANLTRSVATNPGLLCIDEYEQKGPQDEKYQAIGELIRFGYKKGGEVERLRKEPDGTWVQEYLPVYGPKALAGIATLDPVTRSRFIEIAMEPTTRTIPEFKADRSAYAALINDLHYFGLAHAPHIARRYADWTPEKRQAQAPAIKNRQWEIAGPLIVMADYVGGEDFTEPLIEWFTQYFERKKQSDDNADMHRTLVIALPSVLLNKDAYAGNYYRLEDILDTFFQFSDEDRKKSRLKPRSVLRWLAPLGFTETRSARGGTQVRIDEEVLRHVFHQRGITPRDEDLQWLEGKTDYATARDVSEPNLEIWGDE